MDSIDQVVITIITVTYNSAACVREAIESVLAQSHQNIEYIIGDDCSTDETWNIIREYKDSRIKAYRNENNLREYPNRNKAIQMATGKYLIFIDGDDLMYTHAITVFLSFAGKFPDCGLYFSREWDYRILCPFKIYPADIYRFEYLDKGIIGGNFTDVFFNTEVLQQSLLPVNISTGDTYIQLKISKKYPALIIPGNLTWWRKRAGNATEMFFSSYKSYAEIIGYRLALLEENCPLTDAEINLAKRNLYGVLLKAVARMIAKGKISDAVSLLKKMKVPVRYYYSIFMRGSYNHFNYITGDKPLHSK